MEKGALNYKECWFQDVYLLNPETSKYEVDTSLIRCQHKNCEKNQIKKRLVY